MSGRTSRRDHVSTARTTSNCPAYIASDIAAFQAPITSSAENRPDRRYMSAAPMTSSCLPAVSVAASPTGPRAATISSGEVPSTTQMHLSPDARPACRNGIRTWSRPCTPENTPQIWSPGSASSPPIPRPTRFGTTSLPFAEEDSSIGLGIPAVNERAIVLLRVHGRRGARDGGTAFALRAKPVGEVVDDQAEPDTHHPCVLGQRDSLLGREGTALLAHAGRPGVQAEQAAGERR